MPRWRKRFAAETARLFRNSRWRSSPIAKHSRCATASSAAGAMASSWWKRALTAARLITVSQAIEQGRSVYAVPGHINAPTAHGSNRLIQQGAKLVMDASDILDDLQILLPEKERFRSQQAGRCRSSTNERRVYDAINPTETPIDQIASKCDLPSATVSSTLLALELKRLVKQLPGKYFVRLVVARPQCAADRGTPRSRGAQANIFMPKTLVIAEKPSVAQDLARALGKVPKRATTMRAMNTLSPRRSAMWSSSKCRRTSTRRNTAFGGWRRSRLSRKSLV